MTKVHLSVDPERLRKAIRDELDHHHRHLSSGQCACGRSRAKDPAVVLDHIAEEIFAVVARFQGDQEVMLGNKGVLLDPETLLDQAQIPRGFVEMGL
jgi:hypothetical protein